MIAETDIQALAEQFAREREWIRARDEGLPHLALALQHGEQSDEWQVGRCYMARHSLAALAESDEHEQPDPKELEQAA